MRGGAEQSGTRRGRRRARALARGGALALALAAALASAETAAPPYPLAKDREISPSAITRRLPAGMRPPKLDGRLNDVAWEHATKLGAFTQQSPHEGAEPTYPTDVWVLYDEHNIYVGVRAWDPEPEKLIAKVMRRDTSQRSDDRVLITIDTFHDKRNGYMFSTNPLAARWEALIENNQTVRQEWDGIWNVKARVDAEGWTCEFVFPLKTLSFAPGASSWGFNVARSIKRINEESRWASWRQNKFPLDMSEAGTLSVDPNDERVVVGRTLDVVPYGAVGGFLERNVDEINFPPKSVEHRDYSTLDGGLDAFYRLTPSVTGALTFNTDFSDSDVDARQVNLDRFALFFPETRDFFLQDAGIFDFGGIGEQVQFGEISNPNGMPFFSRKIGIYADPVGVAPTEILDIRAGAKVTGRVGRLNFGVMNVQLEDFELHCDLDAARGARECGNTASPTRETNVRIGNKNLSVARAKWNVGAESTAGVIATYGDPNSPGTGHTLGVDFRLRSSHVRGHQVAELIGWAQTTRISGQAREFRALVPDSAPRRSDFESKRDQAYGLRFRYPNDQWFVDGSWTSVGEDFTPTLGFVNRVGIDHLRTFTRRRWRPDAGYVRNYDSLLKLDYVQGLDGHMQTLIVNPTFLEIHNALDDFIYLGAESRSEVVSDVDAGVYPECRGFYINETPLICIPGERFDWRRVQLGFGMAQSRPVALFLDYSYGGFFGGKLHSIEASAELRLSKHFYGQIDYVENRAHEVAHELCTPACTRGERDFVQRLVRLRAQFIFTPDLSWDTFVQYDNLSDSVGWNSRLRWILRPGNELVIIWNESHGANDVEGRDFRFQSAGLTSKLSWTFRF